MWYVYILECRDKSLYAGITKNLKRRVEEHNAGKLGSTYTRGRRPVKLVYSSRKKDRSAALKAEYRIKKLSKPEKLKICKIKIL